MKASVSCPLLLLLAIAAGAGCKKTGEAPSTVRPISVRVAVVRTGDISEVLAVTGQTEALSIVRLAAPVAGRITQLNVRPGDHLAAGSVVGRVIPLENEAALHGFALLEQGDALSADERRRTAQLRADLRTRDIPLRAPFPAIVSDRLHNPGEQVSPGDVIVELFDPASLYVLAQVPVAAAARVMPGMPVEVHSGAATMTGHVTALGAALAPQTLTVPVRLSLSAPIEPPLLHAAVECRIEVARRSHTLVIPPSALVSSTVAPAGRVMVATAGRARHRAVELGLRSPTAVEVTRGLTAGDLVLVDGQYGLPDGTAIQVIKGTEGDRPPAAE